MRIVMHIHPKHSGVTGRFAAILLLSLVLEIDGRSENRVLELDGKSGYVELPKGIFSNLTEATVEMWFNFTSLNDARLFAYGGLENDFGIGNHYGGPHLMAFVNRRMATGGGPYMEAQARQVLETNRWFHVAVTLGPKHLRVYLDGVPTAAHPGTNSLAHVDPAGPFWVGKMNLRPELAHAKLDEIRVWNVARSEADIRKNMFQKMTGQEASLVALWNFDDEANPGRESGVGGHHGQLIAGARTVPEELPQELATFRHTRVLELQGEGDFVTLPDGLLSGLDEVTVEVWAKWSALNYNSRPFDFQYGDASWTLMNRGAVDTLRAEVYGPSGVNFLSIQHFVQTNVWTHLAVSCARGQLTLLVNGQRMLQDTSTNILYQLQPGTVALSNLLGRSNVRSLWPDDRDFQGQLDEVRVWRGVRSEAEIQRDMLQDLSGREPNLVGLWAFDDPANPGKDLTGRAGPAQFHGRAGVVSTWRPQRFGLEQSFFVAGQIKDAAGIPKEGQIQLFAGGTELQSGTTDASGQFVLALRDVTNAFDLHAVAGDLHCWQLGIQPAPGERVEMNPTLVNSLSVTGRVTALNQEGLAGTVIELIRVDSTQGTPAPGKNSDSWGWTVTESDGGYAFRGVRPGAYVVRLHAGWRSIEYQDGKPIEVQDGEPCAAVDFRLAPFKKGVWRHYVGGQGLPSSVILDLAFDPDGVLWVATLRGLCRYDGNDWRTFSTEDGLLDDRVVCLHVQSDGTLWLGTSSGVMRLPSTARRAQGPRFDRFPFGTNGLAGGPVDCIRSGPDGRVWIRTAKGLALHNQGRFQPVAGVTNVAVEIPGRHASMDVDLHGNLWLADAEAGLLRVENTNATRFTPPAGLTLSTGVTAHVSADGALWWAGNVEGSGPSVLRIEGTNCFRLPHPVHSPVRGIRISSTGTNDVWITLDDGLARWDSNRRLLTFYSQSDEHYLQANRVVAHGPDDAIWVGTDSGLLRYEPDVVAEYSEKDGLSISGAMDLSPSPDGSIWFVGPTGVARFRYATHDRYDGAVEIYGPADGLSPNPPCYGLIVEEDGGVWIGGWALFYRLPDGGQRDGAKFAVVATSAALWGAPLALARTPPANLLVATHSGYLIQAPLSELRAGRVPTNSIRQVASGYLLDVHQDGPDDLWLAGYKEGLIHVLGTNVTHFLPNEPTRNFADLVFAVRRGPDRSLWVGTESGALRFDGRQFTAPGRSGHCALTADVAQRMFRDRSGALWFACLDGAMRYDGQTWSVLDEEDGLPSRGVAGVGQDTRGAYWLGLSKGVMRYAPRNRAAPIPWVSVITDQERLDPKTPVTVTKGQMVTFRFGAVDYATLPKSRLYRLAWAAGGETNSPERADSRWHYPSRRAEHQWKADRVGLQTLFVQYVDRDLNYSVPAHVVLDVIVPWHANAWIMAPGGGGVVLLAFGAVYSGVRARQRRREAQALRERLLVEEHKARETAEASAQALATKNSQLEAARREADAASQAKSQFLANMSHELRTPLNAIIGYSEMLEEELGEVGQKEFIPDLHKIHAAARHQLSLINDILDLSKIESGKMTLYLEEFDLAKMIQEVATTVQPLVTKNGNHLEVDCPTDLGPMRADLTKVRQTLFNLLSNASKFTESGVVRLEVRTEDGGRRAEDGGQKAEVGSRRSEVGGQQCEDGGQPVPVSSDGPSSVVCPPSSVTFRVSDTGIGMTAKQISKLFQAFSQADASTTRKFGGTGLGLAISKKFCQMMGGDLTVQSEVGRGSVFTVSLPVDVPKEAAEPGPMSSPPSTRSLPANAPTVLVIDDEPNARELIERTLSKEGFRVVLASDGAGGLALARELKPAAITLDVMMPGMDGWAVLSALKANAATADIPVIMATIVDEKGIGFSLGATDYLTKPIDWARLLSLLGKYRQSTAGQTVLVVEDEGSARELLRRMLEKEGWRIVEAENGKRALERLADKVPALILLDLMMPEMDGFEFMQAFRQRPDCRQVPVIVITAKDLTVEDRKRLDGQVTRILQKASMRTADLVAEIRATLEAGRSEHHS